MLKLGKREPLCSRNFVCTVLVGETTIEDWKTLTTLADSPKQTILRCHIYSTSKDRCRDAPKADSNTEKDLEAHLLLARGARFILRANLWTDAGQGPQSLPNAVLIEFDNYTGPAITTLEGKKLVPMRQTWPAKSTTCSRPQLLICLAWASNSS
ncbi:ATP-dependent DNA helicase PIF1-like [Rhizophagus irregularis DAOM 181602=DAOM 197198]|nr:ATP-dependent DNA helicase PIF1-like [Rhizophagus irregularis DAOM 181602=DAOM 197198]